MTREERIKYFENILNQALLTARQMESALDSFTFLLPALKELEDYYTSDEWKSDFEADEQGLLPKELKRGVLSEDGIDHVLEMFSELRNDICERLGTDGKPVA